MRRPGVAHAAGRGPARALGASLLLAALAAVGAGCGVAPRGTPLEVAQGRREPASGPLVVLAANPRYFTDGAGGRAIYLTGSHTWTSFQDIGLADPPRAFDYAAFLDNLERHGHNFIRMFIWEQAAWYPGTEARVRFSPMPYVRTGPGRAADGGLRFDLSKFDPDYFTRLHDRVRLAGERGFYVSVMLFDGWSLEDKGLKTGNPWRGHPFSRGNNVNGIDGDANGDGRGEESHTLSNPAITALQRAYVRKVVETLGDLDNVLWEISNESHTGSVEWQYEMIRELRALEASRPKRHPVGMTSMYPKDERGNRPQFDSPADWISPLDDARDPYKSDPPASTDSGKVVITDTDHLWGVGGNASWVWKSFMRGLNPLFMDPWAMTILHNVPSWPDTATDVAAVTSRPDARWEDIRVAMGHARAVADRVDLAAMRPMGRLASSGYCLAAPGKEYLAYLPARRGRLHRIVRRVFGPLAAEHVTLDLSGARGELDVEWIDAVRGVILPARPVAGGRRLGFRAPFAGDAVLHVRRRARA